MFRGLYMAETGMLSQQRRIEMTTNNMSNVNTPGFKADQGSIRTFPELMINRLEDVDVPTKKPFHLPKSAQIGRMATGVYMQEMLPNFLQGPIKSTDNNTDVTLIDGALPIDEKTKIPGALFFTVSGEDGKPRYTRNGNFALDSNGYLTTNSGLFVQNTQGNKIQLKSEDFKIDDDGNVFEGGKQLSKINVAYASNPNSMKKEGDGLYAIEGGLPSAAGIQDVTFKMRQGFLEQSNVDAGKSMTDMISAYRAFEANQKIVQAYDRSMDKVANEVGKLR